MTDRLRPGILVTGLVICCIASGGCRQEPPPAKPKGPIRRTVAANTVFMAWQERGPDGRVRPVLELEAQAGQLQQHSQSGTFERAEARVYREGQLMARLRAPHVDATAGNRCVRAWGGVVVHSERPPGLRVDADRLEWYLQDARIVASGRVRFRQRDPETGQVLAEGGVFKTVTVHTERQRMTIP